MSDNHPLHIREMSGSVKLLASSLAAERTYGPYRWRGKTYWRNYHRAIKGGKSFGEALAIHMDRHLQELCGTVPWMTGPLP